MTKSLPRSLAAIVTTAACVLLATGCASMRIDSYVDRSANFTQYRTFAWAASDRLSTGDPRLDNNPFFLERLQTDVEREMLARGYQKATASPDLLLHYHASVTQRIDVAGADAEFTSCEGEGCDPFVYEAGSIVLDLVDAATKKLVWRGWANGSVEGAIDNQDWMERRIDEAVGRIMARLPRNL